MRDKNNRMEVKLVPGTEQLNQTNVTSTDVASDVLVFCDVTDMTEIV